MSGWHFVKGLGFCKFMTQWRLREEALFLNWIVILFSQCKTIHGPLTVHTLIDSKSSFVFLAAYNFNPSWAGLFWKSQGWEGGLLDPQWKHMLYLKKFCPFYMKFCAYTVEQVWIKKSMTWKKFDEKKFVTIWWRHVSYHESHVLTFFKLFRNWWNTKILTGSAKYTKNRWPKVILRN